MKRSTLSVSLFALSVTAFSPGPVLAEKHFVGIPRFRDTPGDGDGILDFEILDAPEGVTLESLKSLRDESLRDGRFKGIWS